MAKLYAFLATIRQHDKAGAEAKKTALAALARLMAPFTPHLAEECWTRLGEAGMVLDAPWPVYDAALAAARTRLAGLEYALKRIDDPEFGYCIDCGEEIGFARLLAMPETVRCIGCAS